jgi:galactofuranose transport system permease protein
VIATGGIDLSVGSLMAIAGALSPMIFMGTLVPISPLWLAITLGIILPVMAAGVFGLFNGWLITRFNIQPIVATLVLFIAGRGLAQVSTNGTLQVFKVPEFQALALGRVLGVPFQVWVMLALVMVAAFLLKRSTFGKQIIAIGGNEAAARLAGIPTRKIKIIVYGISGLCSGLAGLIVIAMNSAADANLVGQGMELDAIAAVAVGGTLLSGGRATIVGTLLGALIIQLVRYTLLANGVPDAAALVVKAGLIILAVWLQQRGGQ